VGRFAKKEHGGRAKGWEMKIGTVKWFNLQKGHGYISPDEGGPNILVEMTALKSAGLDDLKPGQKVVFEARLDELLGRSYAASISSLSVARATDEILPPPHPFDALSAAIATAWRSSRDKEIGRGLS
jgi:cold shock protein